VEKELDMCECFDVDNADTLAQSIRGTMFDRDCAQIE
jgi:hypothetical protein